MEFRDVATKLLESVKYDLVMVVAKLRSMHAIAQRDSAQFTPQDLMELDMSIDEAKCILAAVKTMYVL